MPATRFKCCNQSMTLQEYLAHLETGANRCEWIWEMGKAMVEAQTSHPSHEDGTRISTTVLTGKCLRRLVWERQKDYEVDPADLYAMFRGTVFHLSLEGHAHWQAYAEARFYVTDLGAKIPAVLEGLPGDIDRSFSGSPDLVRPLVGILYDYKRTKETPRYGRAWPDHGAQLNINRWLVDNADSVEMKEEPPAAAPGLIRAWRDDKGQWHALYDMTDPAVRERFVPVDWTDLVVYYADDRGPVPISVTKSIRVPAKKGGTKPARVPDIWEDDAVETYISEHYIEARLALLAGIAPIPAGWEHQSHPLCGKCPFRRECARCEKEGV